jgi:hypothetical protein
MSGTDSKQLSNIYSSEENERVIMILTAIVTVYENMYTKSLPETVEKSMDMAEYIFAAVKQRSHNVNE